MELVGARRGCRNDGPVALITDPARVTAELEAKVVGREIAALEVLAINALKTVSPGLDELIGDEVRSASFNGAGQLEIECRRHTIEVDLARTGVIEHSPRLTFWRPAGTRTPPTGRLLLRDGSGVDFKEPPPTKRITFAVREL